MWEDGALYRAVGGREVRIGPAEGGVEVEPLDAETEAVVRKVLGFDFDLVAFSAWAAGEELLAPLVVRFAGFRPTLAPDPFEMLVGAITAQQVSLFAAVAIRNRLVERFGEYVGRVWAFPTRERLATASRGGALRRSASRGGRRSTSSGLRAPTSTSTGLRSLPG